MWYGRRKFMLFAYCSPFMSTTDCIKYGFSSEMKRYPNQVWFFIWPLDGLLQKTFHTSLHVKMRRLLLNYSSIVCLHQEGLMYNRARTRWCSGGGGNELEHHSSVMWSLFIFLFPKHKPWSNRNGGDLSHRHPRHPGRGVWHSVEEVEEVVVREDLVLCCTAGQ